MALKWTNRQEFDMMAEGYQKMYADKTIKWLARKGEEWLKRCREEGPYKDRTANLRNSIGYVVIQAGQNVLSSFPADIPPGPGGNPPMAANTGWKHAEGIAAGLDKSKTYLILVAGMSYAVYVEKKEHLWVLGQVKAEVEADAQSLTAEFKEYLEYDG